MLMLISLIVIVLLAIATVKIFHKIWVVTFITFSVFGTLLYASIISVGYIKIVSGMMMLTIPTPLFSYGLRLSRNSVNNHASK